jgi:cell shape-determining protein MreC
MRKISIHRPSKPALFAMLMFASLIMILLPPELANVVRRLTEPIAVLQILGTEASQGIGKSMKSAIQRSVPAAKFETVREQNQALINENVTLRQMNKQLQDQISQLAGLTVRGFPEKGILIPARVIGGDAVPGKHSLLVGGSMEGVDVGDPVVTRLTVSAGRGEGVQPNSAVIAKQCLLGTVSQVGTLTARVVLLSDLHESKARRVFISRPPPHAEEVEELPPMYLEGMGRGKMLIRDIGKRHVESGRVRVGDLVSSAANDPKLPMSLVIGQIDKLVLNRDNPVTYFAIVSHLYTPDEIAQVFIADLSRVPESDTTVNP